MPADEEVAPPLDLHRYRVLRAKAFSLTWLSYVALYLGRNNLPVAKQRLSRHLGVSNTELGNVDTAYLAAYAVGQFANGHIGDRVGGKRLILAGLAATAVLNAVFGAAGSLTVLVLAWTLNGVAQSTGWPGCAKVFSRWFARAERGTAMGAWCTCYQVGPTLATLLATWLTVHQGWRDAFFGPALLIGLFAVVFLLLQPRTPEEEGLPGVEVFRERVTGQPRPTPRQDDDAERVSAVRLVLRSRTIWTLGMTYVVLKFMRYSLLFWLPLYLAQSLGYGAGRAGYSSLAFSVAGILGAVVAGLASDRLFHSRRAPAAVLMMLLLALVAWAYPHFASVSHQANIIGIGLIGFFLYGPDSLTSGVAPVDFGARRAAATAAGFVNGMGSIGAALSGIVVGRLSQAHGWSAVFALFPPLALVGAGLLATLWRKDSR